jgi:hypothetical protein
MANISSFSGALHFNTKKNPWTPEGFLLAYDVLMSINACGGDYGICMAEEYTANSADFLVYLMSEDVNPSICFWGNGRWSAENNFDLFNFWTDHKKKAQTMSEETYKETRRKLLELMSDNDWYLQFDYTDEEGGACFIVQQSVDVTVVKDPSTGVAEFTRAITTIANEDYTLDAYCRLIEEEETISHCGMFSQTVDELADVMNVAKEDKQKFEEFLIEKEWHFKLPPYGYYDDIDNVNTDLIEQWKEYRDASNKE